MVVRQTQTPTIKIVSLPIQTKQIIKKTGNLELSTHPVRPGVKLTIPQKIVNLERMQRRDHQEKTAGRTDSSPTKKCSKQLRWECSSYRPNFKLEMPRLHSGTACNRPVTTKAPTLPPIAEVVWQQPSEIFTDEYILNDISNDSTVQNTQETSNTSVASQTSLSEGTQP